MCFVLTVKNCDTAVVVVFFRGLAMLRLFVLSFLSLVTTSAFAKDIPIIELTQTPCQFLEAEHGIDHGYLSQKSSDCDSVNLKTQKERLEKSKTITLAPGKYIFRVQNKNVPYELGFWLRDSDYNWKNPLHKLTKTSVSGGGLTTGVSKDYEIELKAGEYLYSCPLNPTPDYHLVVK
jgi:hypothetical protein